MYVLAFALLFQIFAVQKLCYEFGAFGFIACTAGWNCEPPAAMCLGDDVVARGLTARNCSLAAPSLHLDAAIGTPVTAFILPPIAKRLIGNTV